MASDFACASVYAMEQPKASINDVDPLASGRWALASRGRARRSWYSQTFSDDESELKEREHCWQPVDQDAAGSDSLDRGDAAASTHPSETCRDADANSDASTDVGSDDEAHIKCG